MVRSAVVLSVVLVASLMAGCASNPSSPSTALAAIGHATRSTVLHVDDQSLNDVDDPLEALQQVSDTTLEYVHEGDGLTVQGAWVRYTDDENKAVNAPLSDFVKTKTIEKGNRITVEDAAPYSGFSLVDAKGKTVYSRGGSDAPWVKAGPISVPVAAASGGHARYAMDSSGKLVLSFPRITAKDQESCDFDENDEYTCTSGDEAVSNIGFDGTVTLSGDMELTAKPAGLNTAVDGSFDAKFGVDVKAHADVQEVGDTKPTAFGFDLGMKGKMESRFGAKLNSQHEPVTAGVGGAASWDGHFYLWDDEHTQSERYQPEDFPAHFDEKLPYSEHPVPDAEDMDDLDAELVTMLDQFVGVDLQPGDRMELEFESDGIAFHSEMQVLVQDTRNVGGQTIDTLRMHTSTRLEGRNLDFTIAEGTSWISVDGYLPVFSDISYAKSLGEKELRPLIDLATENGLMEDITVGAPVLISLEGHARLELKEYSPGLQVSGLAYGGGYFLGFAIFGAVMAGDF